MASNSSKLAKLTGFILSAALFLTTFGVSAGTPKPPSLNTTGFIESIPADQAWSYIGIPYPTKTNSVLSQATGFTPWSFDPFITPTPAHPAQWPATAVANHYYIDPTHSAATNTNNPNGTPDQPRVSAPANGAYGPGTYMEFQGEFVDNGPGYQNDIVYQFNCTAELPCWVTGNAEFHSTRFVLGGSSYVFLENLEFGESFESTRFRSFRVLNIANGGGSDTSHLVVRNLNIHDRETLPNAGGNAIALTSGGGGKNHDIVLYNNRCDGVGWKNGQPAFDWAQDNPDSHCFGLATAGSADSAETYNVWIIENELAHAAGNGFQCISVQGAAGEPRETAHHLYLAGNDAHDNQQAGFWSKRCQDIIFSQNRSHGAHGPFAGGNNNGIGSQYGPDWYWVIGNEIYDNAHGTKRSATGADDALNSDTGAGKQFWIGNLYYDNRDLSNESANNSVKKGACFDLWKGNAFSFIVDNTCYGNDSGIRINGGGFGDAYIIGNAIHFLNSPNDPDNFGVCVEITNNLAGQNKGHIHNNLCHSAGGFDAWRFPGNLSAAELNNSPRASGNLTADPLWVNPTTNPSDHDFDLGAGSPALGANIATVTADGVSYQGGFTLPTSPNIDVYQMFEDRYGISIRLDFKKRARDIIASKDIGAFEQQ